MAKRYAYLVSTRASRLMDWFLESDEWQTFESNFNSNLPYNDPERYERILEGSKFGACGSTHGEIIQDWLDCLGNIRLDRNVEKVCDLIEKHIQEVYNWHEKAGTLDKQLG